MLRLVLYTFSPCHATNVLDSYSFPSTQCTLNARSQASISHWRIGIAFSPFSLLALGLVTLRLDLELQGYDFRKVILAAQSTHDFFATHWTPRRSFAGLGALVFASNQGFKDTCVTEYMSYVR